MALKDQKDVLIAWINGETIQSKLWDNNWYDCDPFNKLANMDVIGNVGQYRIKPKEIVTSTLIKRDMDLHVTCSGQFHTHNLRLTWSEDGQTLLKAEVI